MTHYKSTLQAEFHYYPFGLSINLAQAVGAEPQPQLFTNQTFERNEFTQGKGLNLFDFEARTYDPQIGRWWQVDPLAEQRASFSTHNYCVNNPISRVDPSGALCDWFVDKTDGDIIYSKGKKELKIEGMDCSNYESMGPDNMFGDKVKYGSNENILDNNIVIIENSEDFMKKQGYEKAEKILIKEEEYISGGRIDSGEDVVSNHSDLKQIGKSSITYSKEKDLNRKEYFKNNKYSGPYSSIGSCFYKLAKPYGQDNGKTAEYSGNKTFDYKSSLKLPIIFEDMLFNYLDLKFKGVK